MTTEQAYTVVDSEAVQEALNIEYSPTGLYVDWLGDASDDACSVEFAPENKRTRGGLVVSNTVIQELVEEDAIKIKDT